MTTLKTLSVAVLIVVLIGLLAERQWLVRIVPQEEKLLTEQVKSIQRQIGCKKIDGVWGISETAETHPLYKEAVKREERELFDMYAEKYFTLDGSPK